MLKNKKDLDNENRLENIKELLSAMKEFDNLESFLEHVSLATSVDQEWDGEKINMMTMHAAKGPFCCMHSHHINFFTIPFLIN